MAKSLSTWAASELSRLLNVEISEEIVMYMIEIDDRAELHEYICDLTGQNNSDVEDFVSTFINKKFTNSRQNEGLSIYQKETYQNDNINKTEKFKKRKEPKNKNILSEIHNSNSAKTPLDISNNVPQTNYLDQISGQTKKKKSQYVPLYTKEGTQKTNAVMLPGRHPCECQAQKHGLINNCLGCGRVVCMQENSGPCLFCGELVCTTEEKLALEKNSIKSSKLYTKLMSRDGGKDLQKSAEAIAKATAYKNRLLDYDRSYTKRTQVIDDESDYYAYDTNVWLNDKERNLLSQKVEKQRNEKFGSRLNRKVTLDLDFAGRRVIEKESQSMNDIPISKDVLEANFGSRSNYRSDNSNHESMLHPSLQDKAPTYIPNNEFKLTKQPQQTEMRRGVLQDKSFLELSDHGMCLSMHQPWATLLIKGIKMHEGRTWYSSHRGRLWIAAASHQPSEEEIENLESIYEDMGKKPINGFPQSYPISCLLGCVTVADVMAQEDYVDKYPTGDSGSPYVFVCENPLELNIKFPIKGQHKIWKLPSNIHKSAKSNLRL